MKVLICGSRSCPEDVVENIYLAAHVQHLLGIQDDRDIDPRFIKIISGCAKGADKFGENIAKLHNFFVESFPALWNTHGKAAGFIRNADMVKACDMVIALWDGESKGTKHTIDLALSAKKDLHVVFYKDYI